MTTNNLREHLTWLIGSNTFAPPTPGSTPPDFTALLSFSSGSEDPLHQDVHDVVGVSGIHQPITYNARLPRPHSARHQDPGQSFRSGDTEGMARLQSGPRSSKKAKLLSQALPGQLQTPDTHQNRAPSRSLTDQYNARYKTGAY